MESFRPDLVLYDAGVDVHADDDLGRLEMTDEGIMTRDQYVIRQCLGKAMFLELIQWQRIIFVSGRGISVCTVIGGGYNKSLDVISRRHSIVHRAATKVHQEMQL